MGMKQEYVSADAIRVPGDADRVKARHDDRDNEDPYIVTPVTPGIQKLLDAAKALRVKQVEERWTTEERAKEWVFPARRGGSGHLESQQWFFNELSEHSGVKLTSHSVRRLFTTCARGIPGLKVFELEQLLNHSSDRDRKGASVTEGYTPLTLARHRELLIALEQGLPKVKAKL